jgi:hypothetical protein
VRSKRVSLMASKAHQTGLWEWKAGLKLRPVGFCVRATAYQRRSGIGGDEFSPFVEEKEEEITRGKEVEIANGKDDPQSGVGFG